MIILSKNLQKNIVKNDIEKLHTRPFKCDHCLCRKCYCKKCDLDGHVRYYGHQQGYLGDDPEGGLEEEQVGANRRNMNCILS